LKKALVSFLKKALFFPLPTQYNVENQKKNSRIHRRPKRHFFGHLQNFWNISRAYVRKISNKVPRVVFGTLGNQSEGHEVHEELWLKKGVKMSSSKTFRQVKILLLSTYKPSSAAIFGRFSRILRRPNNFLKSVIPGLPKISDKLKLSSEDDFYISRKSIRRT